MGQLIIITPTYNHSSLLQNLYHSLVKQTDRNFEWLIINDGSSDKTEEVIQQFVDEQLISISYITKTNSGKSSSLNIAFKEVNPDDMALIVDDDEELYNNAVEIVNKYRDQLKVNKEIGMLLFNRVNRKDHQIISKPIITDDVKIDFFEWEKSYQADGYLAYPGFVLKDYSFPIFEGEKYIGPSVLMMLVSKKYKLLFSKEVIGETEYQPDGITRQGRKLRLKNPIGNLYYCVLLQDKRAGIKTKLKYSMLGYGYYYFRHLDSQTLLDMDVQINKLNILMKLPGRLLSTYWKMKLGKDNSYLQRDNKENGGKERKNYGGNQFRKYRQFIELGSRIYAKLPPSWRFKSWQHIAHKRGQLRIAQRYMLLKTLAKSLGDNVVVNDNVYIFHMDKLSIGSNVSIHPMCYIEAIGNVSIGDNVSLAHGVTIMSVNHGYSDQTVPIKYQEVELGQVIIEDDVWVGAKATILKGVKIGKGSVIGAGAVVTKNVDAGSVVGGVPAHLIKKR